MLHQPQGPPPPPQPQDTSFKPSPPRICFHAYGTNTTADVPQPSSKFPGEKEITWEKRDLEVGVVLRTSF